MSRYFYTDPLAAAWMAKHFGMRFKTIQNSLYAERYDEIAEYKWRFDLNHIGNKFYIHPDSLHLLEPQLMDMVQGFQNDDIRLLFPKEKLEEIKKSDKVIQRNHVQFMWPEIKE